MMKRIRKKRFVRCMEEALYTAHFMLRPDVLLYLQSMKVAQPECAQPIVDLYSENAAIAKREERALCQDTGYVQVYLYMGRVCCDFSVSEAIEETVRSFYEVYSLRSSLTHPLTRENTRDNTPVFIHTEWTGREGLECVVLIKGGGSENVTRARLFLPTDDVSGIEDWVVSEIEGIGSKGCPPYLLGLCIGGTLEKALGYSKQMLLKPLGFRSREEQAHEIASRLKNRINALPIGFQGLGFGETVMDAFVKIVPCHIATLPVAFSLGCNAVRQAHFAL